MTSGVRLVDAVQIYPAALTVRNTRETYAVALDRVVADFASDTGVSLLGSEPDRVCGWFTVVWGARSAKTFNIRLTGLASACGYWREQGWPTGDPLVRLRARPAPPDTRKALSRERVAQILGSDAPLRERVLWYMRYESSARADEVLMRDVPDLDTANRCAVVTRKGGAREVITWQTGTARLLPRMLAGRRSGPLFLTDRKARPSVAVNDVAPATGRARLSYCRAAELIETHTAVSVGGLYTLHQPRHSRLTHAAGGWCVYSGADEAIGTHVGTQPGRVHAGIRRGVAPVSGRPRPRRAAAVRLAVVPPRDAVDRGSR